MSHRFRPSHGPLGWILAGLFLLGGLALGCLALGAGRHRPSTPTDPFALAAGSKATPSADHRSGAAPVGAGRAMRLLWRTGVSLNDSLDRRVTDLQSRDGRLYYVGDQELGCVETATGRVLWKHSPPTRGGGG